MSWTPRLVATDLDGTLLRPDLQVSPRTRAVLARVAAAAVPLVLVTGRPVRWLAPVVDQFEHRGIAVCANGAVTWDLATGSMVASDPLDPARLAEVTRVLRAQLPTAAFAVERDGACHHELHYELGANLGRADMHLSELADLVGLPAVKLLVRDPTYGADELAAAAERVLGDTVTVTHSAGYGLLEISAVGVTKASGLARVAETHGVAAADVVAFGDMPNDLPMLGMTRTRVMTGFSTPPGALRG